MNQVNTGILTRLENTRHSNRRARRAFEALYRRANKSGLLLSLLHEPVAASYPRLALAVKRLAVES